MNEPEPSLNTAKDRRLGAILLLSSVGLVGVILSIILKVAPSFDKDFSQIVVYVAIIVMSILGLKNK